MSGAARLYCSLLWLYPRSYRRAFGAQMLQTFVDWHDDVAGADGRIGVAVWLPMIADEARNIAGQRQASLMASGFLRAHGPMLALPALPALLFLVTGIGGRDAVPERPQMTDVAGPATSAHLRTAHDPTTRAAGAPAVVMHTAPSAFTSSGRCVLSSGPLATAPVPPADDRAAPVGAR